MPAEALGSEPIEQLIAWDRSPGVGLPGKRLAHSARSALLQRRDPAGLAHLAGQLEQRAAGRFHRADDYERWAFADSVRAVVLIGPPAAAFDRLAPLCELLAPDLGSAALPAGKVLAYLLDALTVTEGERSGAARFRMFAPLDPRWWPLLHQLLPSAPREVRGLRDAFALLLALRGDLAAIDLLLAADDFVFTRRLSLFTGLRAPDRAADFEQRLTRLPIGARNQYAEAVVAARAALLG